MISNMRAFNRISLSLVWILGLAQNLVQSQDLVERCVKPKYEFGSYCYVHSGSGPGAAWNFAWVDCTTRGGRLMTIADEATQNYIVHNIIWKEFGKSAEVWLGATEHYSPWKWVNTNGLIGEPFLSLAGCYKIAGGPDLGPEVFTIDQMIPEKCVQKCLAYRFAIVQGSRCWCKEKVGSYPKVSKVECSTPCSGDTQLRCGGESAIHVYHTHEREGTYFNWAKTSFTDGFNCVAYDKEIKGWVNATCNSRNGYGYACHDKNFLHVELYDDSKTWFEARAACAKKGPSSDLAKINSSALSEDIAKKAMLRDRSKRFWIGATNREWNWIPSGDPVIYSKWFDGYPQGEHKSCLMMKGHVGVVFSNPFSWENADCNETKPYICQHYKYKTTPAPTQSTTTNAETSTFNEVTTTTSSAPTQSRDLSTIVTEITSAATNEKQTITVDASMADTGRQEDKGDPFPMTLIVVVTVILLIAIALVIVIVYFVKRKRSQTPNGAKPSQDKSVHFSQNPLYKSSDDAADTDENLAVNIYGTQDDLASSLYDNPAHKAPNTTGPPLSIQQSGPAGGSRYSIESSDLPSHYVGMTMKGPRSPSNDTLRSDDVEFLTDDTPDLYVSADQLEGVGGFSNPIYDLPSNIR